MKRKEKKHWLRNTSVKFINHYAVMNPLISSCITKYYEEKDKIKSYMFYDAPIWHFILCCGDNLKI